MLAYILIGISLLFNLAIVAMLLDLKRKLSIADQVLLAHKQSLDRIIVYANELNASTVKFKGKKSD